MPKIKLAVCDTNTSYRERFVSYLAHHKAKEAEVYAYSKMQLFLEERKEIPFEIVILGEGFLELVPELEKENIPMLVLTDAQTEHVLVDTQAERMREAGRADYVREESAAAYVREACDEMCIQKKTIYFPRYQSMEAVWQQIKILTAGCHCSNPIKNMLSSIEIVGVYAPGGHEMQLFFSLLYAGILAKESRVLYLNFMPYVSFEELFGREDEYNMSDLVLALRSHQLTAEQLHEFINEMDGVSYIAPFDHPENVCEMTWTDYQEILRVVQEYTDYEVLVIDFGVCVAHFAEMLDCCQRILIPAKEGFVYQCQRKQFLAYLKSEKPELEKRMQEVALSFQAKWIHGGGNLMEQLKWSEFGDYIRRSFLGGKE